VSDIYLVKQASLDGFTEAEKEAVRKFLFHAVDGHGKQGKSVWRRFWSRITSAEVGEMFRFITKQDRSGKFHRFHMALEQRVFDQQERFENFDQYRDWLKIGAGYCTWVPGPKGGIVPLPKSTSFAECDEDQMREVHENMVAFLRTPYTQKTLWPHLKEAQRGEVVETLMREFDQ
jgi:hypothetical protein